MTIDDFDNKENTKNLTRLEKGFIEKTEIDSIMENIPMIFSRVETVINKPFKVIDDKKLAKIQGRLKELNEKMYIFGKRDSHSTRKLMTLQMLTSADSTYRILKQILAQIEKKQTAISESYLKLKKDYIRLNEIKLDLNNIPDNETIEDISIKERNDIKKEKLLNMRNKKQINISNSFIYLEGALKEIGLLEDAYEQIKKNKNIPDDWDELDFEREEIVSNIRSAFRNCIRDFLCSGRIGMGTAEYFEQFGISPIEATFHVRNYIEDCNDKMRKVNSEKDYHRLPDYDNLHDFLNEMATLYKNHYKKACKRIGLDDVISEDFLVMSLKNQESLLKLKEENNENNEDD